MWIAVAESPDELELDLIETESASAAISPLLSARSTSAMVVRRPRRTRTVRELRDELRLLSELLFEREMFAVFAVFAVLHEGPNVQMLKCSNRQLTLMLMVVECRMCSGSDELVAGCNPLRGFPLTEHVL